MYSEVILPVLLFFPLVSALFIFLLPKKIEYAARSLSFYVTLVNLVLSVYLFSMFTDSGDLQYQFFVPWIENLGINFHLGVDGISLLLVLITNFFMPLVIMSSWNKVNDQPKTFYISVLFLQSFILGSLLAVNMFVFYVFWELMLLPVFLMIVIWGESKKMAIVSKFFIYTFAGSLTMLFSLLYLYQANSIQSGLYSFDFQDLSRLNLSPEVSGLLFFLFLLAFAVKAPLFPFHTWLPDTYSEAPVTATVILSALMAKVGIYGIIRFVIPLFSEQFYIYSGLLMILAVIGTIYGGLIAMVQKDLKRLVAYSSISHIGYIILGVFALNVQSLQGSVFHMVNHALSTGALFLMIAFLEERIKTRDISATGGLMKSIPVFGTFFLIMVLSSIGLPGLNGFVGEFLIFLGVFGSNQLFSALGATGIIIGAVYLLGMFRKVMFGEQTDSAKNIPDLSLREVMVLLPITVMIFILGIYPQLLLEKTEASVKNYVQNFNLNERSDYTTALNK